MPKASSKTYRENSEDKDHDGKSCLAYFKTTPRTPVWLTRMISEEAGEFFRDIAEGQYPKGIIGSVRTLNFMLDKMWSHRKQNRVFKQKGEMICLIFQKDYSVLRSRYCTAKLEAQSVRCILQYCYMRNSKGDERSSASSCHFFQTLGSKTSGLSRVSSQFLLSFLMCKHNPFTSATS